MSDRFNITSPLSAFVSYPPLAARKTPEWNDWEHRPVQNVDLLGPAGNNLNLWDNSMSFQQSWPSLNEPIGATQGPRDDVIAQACYSVGIQDSMTYESCDPSLNLSRSRAQQVNCSTPRWCPTPPNPKPECQECHFRELCHKRSKDRSYRRMHRRIQSKDKDIQSKDKDIQFLKKRVRELEQALICQKLPK